MQATTRFWRTGLLSVALLLGVWGCGNKETAPGCIRGVVLSHPGCPNTVLIQVLNEPGLGRPVVLGNASNAGTKYDNVVRTLHRFREDISVLAGKTIYFRYAKSSRDVPPDSEVSGFCPAIYADYDVPLVRLTGYSLIGCEDN